MRRLCAQFSLIRGVCVNPYVELGQVSPPGGRCAGTVYVHAAYLGRYRVVSDYF